MSFFDEVETTVANTRFLQAVEDHAPIVLELTDFSELADFEEDYRKKAVVKYLIQPKTVRYYQFKKFLRENEKVWVDFLDSIDKYRDGATADRKKNAQDLYVKYFDPSQKEDYTKSGPRLDGDADKIVDLGLAKEAEKSRDRHDTETREKRDEKRDGKEGHKKHKEDPEEEKRRLAALRRAIHNAGFEEGLERIRRKMVLEHPPPQLFKGLRNLVARLLEDRLPSFFKNENYKKLVQLEHYSAKPLKLKDFRIFRVLGRGAFGAVSAVQKIDTHAIYAMKEMNKKQVKQNHSEWMVIIEKKVLAKMRSPFVLNLKYSFHNSENLYLLFDMCTGGDLKFHLRQSGRETKSFSVERARFYAAEVFLGLEHIHSFNIIYRDLKPNNILLDMSGHVKISDLGLAIKLRPNKVLKHLAGTAGYWAPEIVMKTGTYKVSDYWSFATFLYEMINGKRPRCKCAKKSLEWCPFGQTPAMEQNALKDEGILRLEMEFPSSKFSPEAKDLLEKLFVVDPKKRLGAGGAHEIKEHPFFKMIDWELLQTLEIVPPFIPDARTVHANSIGEVGEFPKRNLRKVKLTEEDEKNYENFTYISEEGIQDELVTALVKQDNPPALLESDHVKSGGNGGCCKIL